MFLFRSPTDAGARPVNATEAGLNRVMSAIRSAADTTGAGFDYLLKTARRESGLQPTAQAPSSSARGLFQFIDSTWLTVMRDQGPRLGLGRYAEQIGTGPGGRPVVADPAARQQILALRDDPQVSALLAGAFTNRNAEDLRAATGRAPTEGELYMAHFLGAGGARRLIQLNEQNPGVSAATQFPDAASANRRIFFDRGRPRSVAEVYQVLAAGNTVAVAQAGQGAPVTPAADPAPDRSAWSSIPGVRADPARPFHGLFSTGGGGPINAFIQSTWAALGRRDHGAQPRVTVPAALTRDPAALSREPLQLVPAAAETVAERIEPLRMAAPSRRTERRGGPLDLGQFMRPAR